jgi:Holliday junction resolvasome RuvABC endonuclease subunit
MTFILGIDPGGSGAGAFIRVEAGVIAGCHIGPIDFHLLVPLAVAQLAVVEAQHSSPQQGVRSAFALGQAYGIVRGLLAPRPGLRVEYVQPAVWRGSYGLGGGAAGKAAGIALARDVLREPDRPLTHDEADAVLLAWWGWRNVLNKEKAP